MSATPAPSASATADTKSRRHAAYQTMDAAYRARELCVGALEFGKRLVRLAKHTTNVFLTREQLAEAHPNPVTGKPTATRTITTWTQQLVRAGVIWIRAEGTRHRIFITAYEPSPQRYDQTELDADLPPADYVAREIGVPDVEQLAQTAVQLAKDGDTTKAAALLFQAAMSLAATSPVLDAQAVIVPDGPFCPPNGDRPITTSVTLGSPTSFNKSQ